MTTVPHIDHGMPAALYHRAEGVSHSELKLLRTRSPWHLYMQRQRPEAPTARKPTPQMLLGTALHAAVLEPEVYAAAYVDDLEHDADGKPLSRNTKAYKEFAQECANFNLTPLTAEERERIRGMRESLLRHPRVAEALGLPGWSEVSAWWVDPATKVLCRMRADRVCHFDAPHGPTSLLLDLKSTSSATRDDFARSVHTFGYHTQADHYVKGYAHASGRACEGMLFLVVESDYPYACAAYGLDPQALAEGRRLNEKAMRTYAACMGSGEWPAYDDSQPLTLPRWAITWDDNE